MENLAKKIIEESYKWYEETLDWKKDDWINYQINMFNKFKNTEWTKKAFPELEKISYEELTNFKTVDEWPSAPEGFPAVKKLHTTGTVSRKYVVLSLEDVIFNSKVICTVNLRLYSDENRENGLFIVSDENSVSSGAANSLKLFFKKSFITKAERIKEDLNEIKSHAPYTYLFAAQVVTTSLLENLDELVFKEGLVIVNFADILYKSFLKFLKKRLGELGLKEFYVHDAYGATEASILAISYDYKEGNLNLIMSPDLSAMILEKENGERVNLFEAKPGDRGELLLTPFRTFMVPNYRIKDIIEVIDINSKTGLPEIRVLGRKVFDVEIKHPAFGTIKGETGAMIKLGGAPINPHGIDEAMAKFTSKYFIFIYKKKHNRYLFKLYVDKPIEVEDLLEEFKKHPMASPVTILARMGAAEIDIEVKDIKFIDYLEKNYKGGQPKMHRVILVDEEED